MMKDKSTLPRPDATSALSSAAATGVTLASICFTTWAVADLARLHAEGAAPLPVAVAVGLAVELIWLYVLTQEWAQAGEEGKVARGLAATGWTLAAVAAAIITVHALLTWAPMAVLAVLPLGAKAAWHWRTTLRARATRRRLDREAEEVKRAAALSTAPTPEEEQELAERARRLAVRRQELELELAEAELESEARIRQVEREGRARLAQARAHFTVAREVQEQDREIGYYQAPSVLALGSGEVAPDSPSSLGGPHGGGGAGFGAAMAQARMQPAARTGPDQEVGQVPGPGAGTQVHPSALEAERNRAACAAAFARLLGATQETPSIAAVAEAAGISDRAAGRHLRKLGLIS